MRIQRTVVAALVAASGTRADGPTTGELGNATVVENNPPGMVYQAVLPDTAFSKNAYPKGGNIKGKVTAVASPDGIGVMFKVEFANLPSEGGPFLYHLHVDPVPDDGNCTSTLGHLDPYIRGETAPCDGALPQTCQVGDLSGKHGKITTDIFTAQYTDDFASTLEGIGAFFGNRSLVVHFANKTRITCANFKHIDDSGPDVPTPTTTVSQTVTQTGSTSSTATGTGSSTSTSSAARVTTTFSSSPTGTARPTIVTVAAADRLSTAILTMGALSFAAACMLLL